MPANNIVCPVCLKWLKAEDCEKDCVCGWNARQVFDLELGEYVDPDPAPEC